MQLFEPSILAQAAMAAAPIQKLLELDPARARRGAAMPRHGQRTAGVGEPAALLDGGIPQPAPQKAAHERVAGAQHVQHLDRKARAFDPPLDIVRHRARKPTQPIGPRLTTMSAPGARSARTAARVSVLPPARWISSSVPTIRSHAAGWRCSWRSPGRWRRSAPRRPVAGEAPEDGPVVDVQYHAAAMRLAPTASRDATPRRAAGC